MAAPESDADIRRKFRQSFDRREKTVLTKAGELADLCGAKVYVFIAHDRDTVVYKSVEDPEWPPPDKELLSVYPKMRRIGEPGGFKSETLHVLLSYFATRQLEYESLQEMITGLLTPVGDKDRSMANAPES